jgi:diguanylate cyclase (GGDEF)-like protein
MAGHSILYLGSNEFAADWLQHLQASSCCSHVWQSEVLLPPGEMPGPVDLVLFEAVSPHVRSGRTLQSFVHALRDYPLVALTRREQEHRGIAAVNLGAQGFVCIDDAAEEQAVFDHALKRHQLLQRLADTDGTVLSILKSINDGAIVVDTFGQVLDINPAARSMLGLSPRERPPADWTQHFCNVAIDGASRITGDELPLVKARKGQKFSNQFAVYRSAGQADVILSINGCGLCDGDGDLVGGVITFRDVTDLIHRTIELEKRAQYDELTALPNRSLFLKQLEKAIGRGKRNHRPIAVLFIDLDRFKSVNDTLGHDVGDLLLAQVAQRLTSNLRIGDMSARWGGDEFVVCLEDFGESRNAAAAAQKLVLVLSEKYDVKGSEVYVTPSVGIAVCPDSGDDPEQLVKAADLAMYQAKRRGGSRFQFYSTALNNQLEQREELEVGLRHALVRGEFVLHFQPRVETGSGRLIGFEALLRWQHPRFGLLPPARFLSILESSGLIHSTGEWVVDSACRQLASWQHRFELPDLAVSINLSPQQLIHGRLVGAVAKSLSSTSLDPGCIEFEIGDSDVIRTRSSEAATLKGLRSLGVRLSLDHFGIRDVSFRSLDDGVIDSFIIDQSLIRDVAENGSHQRIVRAAIAMARGLDIEVAAEGVETMPQLEFLKSCHCDLVQGFLISRPMEAAKVSAVLRSEIAGTHLLRRG